MGDWKPLIFGLVIIFILGGLLSLMLSPFIDVEQQTEDTWISPFVSVSGFMIDLISFPVRVVVSLIEGITGIFSIGESYSDIYLEVSGTGTHEGETLDGRYYAETSPLVLVNENNWRDKIFYQKNEDNVITEITIESSRYTFFYFTHKEVYKIESPSQTATILTLTKTAEDLNFNPTATITAYFPEDLENSISLKLSEFFNLLKENVQNSIKTLGLIPATIGLPLMLVLLVGILYAIIKLFPTT